MSKGNERGAMHRETGGFAQNPYAGNRGGEKKSGEVTRVLDALGAIAEALGVFRRELIANGFSESDAVGMCAEYMVATFCPNNGRGEAE